MCWAFSLSAISKINKPSSSLHHKLFKTAPIPGFIFWLLSILCSLSLKVLFCRLRMLFGAKCLLMLLFMMRCYCFYLFIFFLAFVLLLHFFFFINNCFCNYLIQLNSLKRRSHFYVWMIIKLQFVFVEPFMLISCSWNLKQEASKINQRKNVSHSSQKLITIIMIIMVQLQLPLVCMYAELMRMNRDP